VCASIHADIRNCADRRNSVDDPPTSFDRVSEYPGYLQVHVLVEKSLWDG